MSGHVTICVGTVGAGVWLSPDGGESWRRIAQGLGGESRVFGLAVHPTAPHTVLAGAGDGLYCSHDGGRSFEHLDTPMNEFEVWKIAFDPSQPETIFAGTRPAALFRSDDGGRRWRRLPVEMVEECPNVGVPRITALTVDPQDRNLVWAGVEVDGVRCSLDGGETWARVPGVTDPDIHDIGVRVKNGDKCVLVSTPHEIFCSTDSGETWRGLGVGRSFRFPYCRHLAIKSDDPDTLFVATGDAAVGTTGAIERSQDGGRTWERLALPNEPNSPMWAFATHPADPGLIFACSHYGQLYRSRDCGDSWTKLRREFTQTRTLAWTPN